MSRYSSPDNFNNGFGKNLLIAFDNAVEDTKNGGLTKNSTSQRMSQFAQYCKESGIKDSRDITEQTVKDYGQTLIERDLQVNTVQSAITAINSTMNQMREGSHNEWQSVSPKEVAGERTFVRTEAPFAMDKDKVAEAQAKMIEAGLVKEAAILGLAANFGTRLEEALKADLNRWQSEAMNKGIVNIQEGSKGNRSELREVTVTTENQAVAFENAMKARDQGSSNLIPNGQTFKQAYQTPEARSIMKEVGLKGYHDARAAYACNRYKEITGKEAPCVAGHRTASKEADIKAREIISKELGHGRIDVTAAYVGSAK